MSVSITDNTSNLRPRSPGPRSGSIAHSPVTASEGQARRHGVERLPRVGLMLPDQFPKRSDKPLKSLIKQAAEEAEATLLDPAAWVLRGQGAEIAQLPCCMCHLGRFMGVMHFHSEMSV